MLAFTAAKMIVSEPTLASWFDGPEANQTAARWGVYLVTVVGVLLAGRLRTGGPKVND